MYPQSAGFPQEIIRRMIYVRQIDVDVDKYILLSVINRWAKSRLLPIFSHSVTLQALSFRDTFLLMQEKSPAAEA